MASMQGTTQAYQPMSDTYVALTPSCGDKLFGSNIDYCNLVSWGIYDGQERDPRILNAYQTQQQQLFTNLGMANRQAWNTFDTSDFSLSPSNQSTTVWNLMNSLPQLSQFTRMMKRANWDSYIANANPLSKVTVFAPNNGAISESPYAHIPFENWNKNNLRLLGQAHTLPFVFEQSSAINRKLRLYTALDAFSVYIDGTGQVSKQLNFYIPPDQMLLYRYPQPLKRINVIQGYYTNDGALYEIDGVFEPQIIVT